MPLGLHAGVPKGFEKCRLGTGQRISLHRQRYGRIVALKQLRQRIPHLPSQQLGQGLGMTVAQSRVGRRRQLVSLAQGAAEHAVNQPRSLPVGVFLALVHRLVDCGRGRNLVQKPELIESQPENIQHHRLEPRRAALDQAVQPMVQQQPVLHHAVNQPRGQGSVPAVQAVPGDIFLEGPVGPSALPAAGNQRGQRGGSGVHTASLEKLSRFGWDGRGSSRGRPCACRPGPGAPAPAPRRPGRRPPPAPAWSGREAYRGPGRWSSRRPPREKS